MRLQTDRQPYYERLHLKAFYSFFLSFFGCLHFDLEKNPNRSVEILPNFLNTLNMHIKLSETRIQCRL